MAVSVAVSVAVSGVVSVVKPVIIMVVVNKSNWEKRGQLRKAVRVTVPTLKYFRRSCALNQLRSGITTQEKSH